MAIKSFDFSHVQTEHNHIFSDEISAVSVTSFDIGLQSGKKSINWVSVGDLETLRSP